MLLLVFDRDIYITTRLSDTVVIHDLVNRAVTKLLFLKRNSIFVSVILFMISVLSLRRPHVTAQWRAVAPKREPRRCMFQSGNREFQKIIFSTRPNMDAYINKKKMENLRSFGIGMSVSRPLVGNIYYSRSFWYISPFDKFFSAM